MAEAVPNALPSGYLLRKSYRIDGVLGAGGFGITYLAHHTGLDQKVAIKEYMPDQFAIREEGGITVRPRRGEHDEHQWGLARFADEARTLAKFKHPGIVPVNDIFEANGTAYMVMEYVEGDSLEELLDRDGVLPAPALRLILDPLLGALEVVHGQGILHRDIKPANIYIRKDGSPVLLDFGNARQALGTKTSSLTATLTPGYAPSEQYATRGKQGAWTDIYALGATLYRSITGHNPPESPERALDDNYISSSKATKGGYSPALLAAIDAALAFRPEDRPQSVANFRKLLEGSGEAGKKPSGRGKGGTILPAKPAEITGRTILAGAPLEASLATLADEAAPPPPGRGRVLVPAIALALVIVLGGGYWGWSAYRDSEQRRVAEITNRTAEEAKRKVEAEAKRKTEEERRQSEEAARKQAESERRKQVQEAKRKAEEKRRSVEESKRRDDRRQRLGRRVKARLEQVMMTSCTKRGRKQDVCRCVAKNIVAGISDADAQAIIDAQRDGGKPPQAVIRKFLASASAAGRTCAKRQG